MKNYSNRTMKTLVAILLVMVLVLSDASALTSFAAQLTRRNADTVVDEARTEARTHEGSKETKVSKEVKQEVEIKPMVVEDSTAELLDFADEPVKVNLASNLDRFRVVETSPKAIALADIVKTIDAEVKPASDKFEGAASSDDKGDDKSSQSDAGATSNDKAGDDSGASDTPKADDESTSSGSGASEGSSSAGSSSEENSGSTESSNENESSGGDESSSKPESSESSETPESSKPETSEESEVPEVETPVIEEEEEEEIPPSEKSYKVTLGTSGYEDRLQISYDDGVIVSDGDELPENSVLAIAVDRQEDEPYLILTINGERHRIIEPRTVNYILKEDVYISLGVEISMFSTAVSNTTELYNALVLNETVFVISPAFSFDGDTLTGGPGLTPTHSWNTCLGAMSGRSITFNISSTLGAGATITSAANLSGLTINGNGTYGGAVNVGNLKVSGGATLSGGVTATNITVDAGTISSAISGNVTKLELINAARITGVGSINVTTTADIKSGSTLARSITGASTVTVDGAGSSISNTVTAKAVNVTDGGSIGNTVTTTTAPAKVVVDGTNSLISGVVTANVVEATGGGRIANNVIATTGAGTVQVSGSNSSISGTVGANAVEVSAGGSIGSAVTATTGAGTVNVTGTNSTITGVVTAATSVGVSLSGNINGKIATKALTVNGGTLTGSAGIEVTAANGFVSLISAGTVAHNITTNPSALAITSVTVSGSGTDLTGSITPNIGTLTVSSSGVLTGAVNGNVDIITVNSGTIAANAAPITKVSANNIEVKGTGKINRAITDDGAGNITVDGSSEITAPIAKNDNGNITVSGSGKILADITYADNKNGTITVEGSGVIGITPGSPLPPANDITIGTAGNTGKVDIVVTGGTILSNITDFSNGDITVNGSSAVIAGDITKHNGGSITLSNGGQISGNVTTGGLARTSVIIGALDDAGTYTFGDMAFDGVDLRAYSKVVATSFKLSDTAALTTYDRNSIVVKDLKVTGIIDIRNTTIGEIIGSATSQTILGEGSINLDYVELNNKSTMTLDGESFIKITTNSTNATGRDVVMNNMVENRAWTADFNANERLDHIIIGVETPGDGTVTMAEAAVLPNATIVGHDGAMDIKGSAYIVKATGTSGSGMNYTAIALSTGGVAVETPVSGANVANRVKIIDAPNSYVKLVRSAEDLYYIDGHLVDIRSTFANGVTNYHGGEYKGYITTNYGINMQGASTGIYDLVYASGNLQPVNASNISIPTGTVRTFYYGSNKNALDTSDAAHATKGTLNIGSTQANFAVNYLYLGGNNQDITGPVALVISDSTHTSTGARGFKTIYLGGSGTASITGTVTYDMSNGTVIDGNLYGSGDGSGSVGAVAITLTSGTVNNVYGGGVPGNVAGAAQITVPATSTANVKTNLYGGGQSTASATNVGGAVTLNIYKDIFTTATSATAGTIFGGAHVADAGNATVTGTIAVNIGNGTTAMTLDNRVFGGGRDGGTTKNTTGNVTITVAKVATINGTDLTAYNSYTAIYGGGQNAGVGTVKINLADTSVINADIYGGGALGGAVSSFNSASSVIIDADSGKITRSIYGGGFDTKTTSSVINVGATAKTNNDATPTNNKAAIYGGGRLFALTDAANVTTGTTSIIVAGNADIKAPNGNNNVIFGGGRNATVSGTTRVVVNTGATLTGNLYGGSSNEDSADIPNIKSGNATIEFYGTGAATSAIFGGGYTAGAKVNHPNTTTATVHIVNNTAPFVGNVYGGGNGGVVGDAKVYIGSATATTPSKGLVTGNVYGGGLNGETTNAEVNINGVTATLGSVTGSVYGGGQSAPNSSPISPTTPRNANVTGKTEVTIGGTVLGTTGNIYGGGQSAAATQAQVGSGGTKLIITGNISGYVYGGGHGLANSADVTVAKTDIDISGNTVSKSVYGGGHADAASAVNGTHKITADVGGITVVKITDATVVQSVYGGGHIEDATNRSAANSTATVSSNAGVTLAGVTVNADVYGGGHVDAASATASVGGDAVVKIGASAVPTQSVIGVGVNNGFVYGGGHAVGNNATASVSGKTDIALNNTTTVKQSVYGGGYAVGSAAAANVTKNAVINTVSGTDIAINIYGGGHATGTSSSANVGAAANDTTVTVNGAVGTNGTVGTGYIYGGGHATASTSSANVTADTLIVTANGNAQGSVYGGGFVDLAGDYATASAKVTGDVAVNINASSVIGLHTADADAGYVYGGGRTKGGNIATTSGVTATVTGKAKTIITTGTIIPHSVYGGGHAQTPKSLAQVIGGTDVSIGRNVTDYVYGGGHAVAAQSNTDVTVGGVKLTSTSLVLKNLYGGGHAVGNGAVSKVSGTAETIGSVAMTVSVNTVTGTVGDTTATGTGYAYGGGHAIDNNTNADVTGNIMLNSGSVTGSIYGGGHVDGAATTKANAEVSGSIIVIASANVGANNAGVSDTNAGYVFGGGRVEAGTAVTAGDLNADVTGVTNVTVAANATPLVESVYGGGHAVSVRSTAQVIGGTTVETNRNITQYVYGGGYSVGDEANTDIAGIGTTVYANNPVIQSVYGGGHAVGETSNARVTATGTKVDIGAAVSEFVYGGGHALSNATNVNVTGRTDVTVKAGNTVTKSVFGGGHIDMTTTDAKAANSATADVNGTTRTEILGSVSDCVYGGGHLEEVASTYDAATSTADVTGTGTTTVIIAGAIGSGTTGFVYGGGFADAVDTTAKVAVSTDVDINSGGRVLQTVFGGGLANKDTTDVTVGNKTTVDVNGTGIVNESVYGGGHANVDNTIADVTKTTQVTIDGTVGNASSIKPDVYGGGRANADTAIASVGDNTSSDVLPATKVDVKSAKTVLGNVYGGGHVVVDANAVAQVKGYTNVIIDGTIGSTGTGFVYGGGYNETGDSDNAYVLRDAIVLIGSVGTPSIKGTVYGGGRNASVKQNTKVTMTSGVVDIDVYGGGHGENQDTALVGSSTGNSSTVKVDTNAEVKGNVYGAGHGQLQIANLDGFTNVTINGKVGVASDGYVYGGGRDDGSIAEVSSNAKVNIAEADTNNPNVNKSVYGGGRDTKVLGNIEVIMLNGTVTVDVHGGGRAETAKNADVGTGVSNSVKVTVEKGNVTGDVYGAGHSQIAGSDANVLGKTIEVKVQNSATVKNVYGGSKLDSTGTAIVGSMASVANPAFVDVLIDNARINQNVFGGSNNLGGAEVDATVQGKTEVLLQNNYTVGINVYGGGMDSHIDTTTKVDVLNGKVSGDVFGGGYSRAAKSAKIGDRAITTPRTDIVTKVTIDNQRSLNTANNQVTGSVYGAGRGLDADTHGSIEVTVKADAYINTNLFGAGRGLESASPLTGAATNNIRGYIKTDIYGEVGEYAYGGGERESFVIGRNANWNSTEITLYAYGKIGIDLHGGGHNSSVTDKTLTTVMKDADVLRDVYGGTKNDAEANHTIYTVGDSTKVFIHGKVGNNTYGAGWRADTNGTDGSTVQVTGWVVNSVFGGGRDQGIVLGTGGTDVEITGTANVSPNNGILAETDYHTGYSGKGNVYGGGQKADVTNALGKGTNVIVRAGAQVAGVVFGGGEDCDVNAKAATIGGTNVEIYGRVGVVHGGGKRGKTDNTTKGSTVLVTGNDAIVYYYVFGGGLGNNTLGDAQNLKADVLINRGADVKERVFGGGKTLGAETTLTTDVKVTDAGTIIGHRDIHDSFDGKTDTVTGHIKDNLDYETDPTKYYSDFDLRIDRGLANGRALGSFNNLGAVYGGGDNTGVGVSTNVVIDPTGQMVYDIISGGNINVSSTTGGSQIDRTVTINNLGSNKSGKVYSSLCDYAVVRMLMDYTVANANDSYLNVYYHLDGYDNGKTIDDVSYPSIIAQFNMYGGVYMPWKPKNHTDVRVEPYINMHNDAQFRMEYGYTIELITGIYPKSVAPYNRQIDLLIDLMSNPGSTTKIFAPNGNVTADMPFSYRQLPSTTVVTNLLHAGAPDILGINVFIPPQNVDDTDGQGTDNGGNSDKDSGTGKPDGGTNSSGGSGGSGGGGGGGGGGGAAGGGAGSAAGKGTTTTSSAYSTSADKVVDHDTTIKQTETAINKAGKGKTATVNEKSAGQITTDTLRAMQASATKLGGSVMYQADTVRGKRIEGRMYIDPSKAANLKGNIKTSVYTSADKISKVSKIFDKFFKNNVVIIRLEHEGKIGMEVKVAALVDLKKLDTTKELYFYAYSTKDNNYAQIKNPRYVIDKNGYIHFYTSVGGHIIVTDQPLAKK